MEKPTDPSMKSFIGQCQKNMEEGSIRGGKRRLEVRLGRLWRLVLKSFLVSQFSWDIGLFDDCFEYFCCNCSSELCF